MDIRQAEEHRIVRTYHWALKMAKGEPSGGVELLSKINSSGPFGYSLTMKSYTQTQSSELLQLGVRRGHADAIRLLGEKGLTQDEEQYLQAHFCPIWQHRIPFNMLEWDDYLKNCGSSDIQNAKAVKYVLNALEFVLSAGMIERRKYKAYDFVCRKGDWIIETVCYFDRNPFFLNLGYNHNIRRADYDESVGYGIAGGIDSVRRRNHGNTDYCNLLGLYDGFQTDWVIVNMEVLPSVVAAMSEVISSFYNSIPEIINGLDI